MGGMLSLVLNIGELVTMSGPDRPRRGAELSRIGVLKDAAVLVEDGRILAAGLRELVLNHEKAGAARLVDAQGRLVTPGFVDAHSHPVFASPRLDDFERRLKGETYAQIAQKGGGILHTVNGVRGATEDQLVQGLSERAVRFLECGTTTLEAKSGYGLSVEDEMKLLRAIKRAAASTPLELVPTVLGAHAIPPEYKTKPADYVRLVCEELIPAAAAEGLARFADVFCEQGWFSVEDQGRVAAAAKKAGLGLRVHSEQLSRSGGVRPALEDGAVSLDHLDCVEQADIDALSAGRAVATLVPGSNYFLGKPYPPARRLIDGGAAVALATDFNPGTCPCWDMRWILSIACAQMRLTPAEALCAATINGAWSLGLGKTHGSLEPGKQADLVCWDMKDHRELAYWMGSAPSIWTMKKGALVHRAEEARL